MLTDQEREELRKQISRGKKWDRLKGLASLCILVFVIGVWIHSFTSDPPRQDHFWMMNGPVPDDGVRIWIPVIGNHETDCDHQKWSPAMALATVYNLTHQVNDHEVHYHVHETDRGFQLEEYVLSNTGPERRLTTKDGLHYHGLYVPLDAANGLVAAVDDHQHGAKE